MSKESKGRRLNMKLKSALLLAPLIFSVACSLSEPQLAPPLEPDPCVLYSAGLDGWTDEQAGQWFSQCDLDQADWYRLAELLTIDGVADTEEMKKATELLGLNGGAIAILADKLIQQIENNSVPLDLVNNQGLIQMLGQPIDSLANIEVITANDSTPIDLAALVYNYEPGQLGITGYDSLSIIKDIMLRHRAQTQIYAWLIAQGDDDKKDNAATSALNTVIFSQLYARLLVDQPDYLDDQIIAGETFREAISLISQINNVLNGVEAPLQEYWKTAYTDLIDQTTGLNAQVFEARQAGAGEEEIKAIIQEFFKVDGPVYAARLAYLDYSAQAAGGLGLEELAELSEAHAAMLAAQNQMLLEQSYVGHVRLKPLVVDQTRVEVGKHTLKVTFSSGQVSEHSLNGPNYSMADILAAVIDQNEGIEFGEGVSLKLVKVNYLGVWQDPDGQNHLGVRLSDVSQGQYYNDAVVLLNYNNQDGLDLNNGSSLDFSIVPPAEGQGEIVYFADGQLPEGWKEISFWSDQPQVMIGGSTMEEVLLVLAEIDQGCWSKRAIAPSMGALVREGMVRGGRTEFSGYQDLKIVNEATPLLRVRLNNLGIVDMVEELDIRFKIGTILPIFPRQHGWEDTFPLSLVPGAQRGEAGEGTIIFTEQVGEREWLGVWAKEVEVQNTHSLLAWYWAIAPQHITGEFFKLMSAGFRMGGTLHNPMEGASGIMMEVGETEMPLWAYFSLQKEASQELVEAYVGNTSIWTQVGQPTYGGYGPPMLNYGWRQVTRGEYLSAVDNIAMIGSFGRTRVFLPVGRPLYLMPFMDWDDMSGAMGAGSFWGSVQAASTIPASGLMMMGAMDFLSHPVLPDSAPYANVYAQPDFDNDPSAIRVP